MNSDEERILFERWGWREDLIARTWTSPTHTHAQFSSAELTRRSGVRPDAPSGPICQQTLGWDDIVAATHTPEGEGVLVGFVMAHGVRKR